MEMLLVLAVGIILLVLLLSGRMRAVDYGIDQHGIVIKAMSRQLMTIGFSEIEEIGVASWLEGAVPTWRKLLLRNRFSSRCVIVRKTSGVSRSVVMTPPSPDAFVHQVRTGMYRSRKSGAR